jgi:predicted aspartyl protease
MVVLGIPPEGIMTDDMGTFRIDFEVENPARPGEVRTISAALVDTGSELSWVPGAVLESLGIKRNKPWHFRQADGTVLERWSGSAVIRVQGNQAGDEIVFALPGDQTLLGARSLEGLNLRVEPALKQLVDAGPAPAAVAA